MRESRLSLTLLVVPVLPVPVATDPVPQTPLQRSPSQHFTTHLLVAVKKRKILTHFCEMTFPIRVKQRGTFSVRLAPVLKTIFHQCVISYTCSLSYSDGSVLRKQSHQS